MARLGAFLLASVIGPFSAAAFGADDDPMTYPVTSFLDWTQNPIQSVQDQSGGQYAFEAGELGIVTRAADRYPAILTAPQDQASIEREAQATYDAVLHNRPTLPYDHAGGDAGSPYFMPDWNHNGVFGDPGDFDADTDGDPHVVPPDHADTAYFLYPCANQDGTVWYETSSGTCAAGGSGAVFKLGVARELKIVDARGLVLDATLWVPGEAFAASACTSTACSGTNVPSLDVDPSGPPLPGVVFSNGLSSRQDHYYWFAMRMAREGFIVLTYDPAGQGQSEGTWTDLFGIFDQHRACDQFSGACRDTMDAVRWFVGAGVPDERGALYADGRVAPRLNPEAENAANPVLSILDADRIAIAGNSMGAISTLNYLNAAGKDPEGKELPRVATAISLSGATPTKATVPIQFQTSDYDGSPILVGPTVFGADLGEGNSGIGYNLIKQLYDELKAGSHDEMELVVLEGGVHTDHVDVSVVPRTMWANAVASDYAADWLKCHLDGDSAACAASRERGDHHLSRAFASEYASASNQSECITVPDRAILNQPPADFVAAYSGKHVCDCAPAPTCDTPPTFTP
jgi:pimeloyl-ACP methyl ester carboxylesterase